MNTFLKNTAILAVGLLSVLSSCSGDFLDNKPTDAVDSGIVPVPSNAGRIFNGAWYNLFEYSSTYANIGYRSTHPTSLTMWGCRPTTAPHLPGI